MLKKTCTALLLMAAITTPALAQEEDEEGMSASEAIFECDGNVSLRFNDKAENAFVRVGGDAEVRLPNVAFNGDEGVIYAQDQNAKSCSGQPLCVAGFFEDQSATFYVFAAGSKHRCFSDNWNGQ